MFEQRISAPGKQTAPKQELVTTGALLTELRLYLVPLRNPNHTKFDQYEWDFNIAYIPPNTLKYKVALYERVGKISGTPSAVLVPNTSVSVTGYAAATLTVTALGSTESLFPGDYFIGFIIQSSAVPGGARVTPNNSHTNNAAVAGHWCYEDQGSFALPAQTGALSYIHAAGENPFWSAVSYTGDVMP